VIKLCITHGNKFISPVVLKVFIIIITMTILYPVLVTFLDTDVDCVDCLVSFEDQRFFSEEFYTIDRRCIACWKHIVSLLMFIRYL